ncbi:hypothetical protein [Paenibacillus tyrfis]|uniref:hypothetical protein n=1 Tax=Paenibacillus tyrfis TaxID=1501230 RepID=UPI0020A15DF6|nr:hypothetical protein [Paenibacillus tyrfis]MCP1312253.1 hypothetical protein [Paenibacillus tyrfis]
MRKVNELIETVERNVGLYSAALERSKKYYDYPFTSNSDHYYKLILLQIKLDCWEQMLNLLRRFKNVRCEKLERRSDFFVKSIEIEARGVPGFVTQQTLRNMIEYMKKLEWKIEELQGIWMSMDEIK